MIKDIWTLFFIEYIKGSNKNKLRYVITSEYRPGNKKSNPHAISGNALDITLRWDGEYAPIKEYNDLFIYMLGTWPYRAGIDNTHGNIHIHLDLGENRPAGQQMPYFFKEDSGKWLYQITDKSQVA